MYQLEELRRVEIPLYIRRIRLENARRPEYYEFGKKKIKAKKYHNQEKYQFKPHNIEGKQRYFLTDMKTGLRVLRNPKSAGTPRDKLINGQDIYNQTIIQEQRNVMLQAIKAFLMPFVESMKPIDISDFPIRLEAEIHDTILSEGKSLWDIDNRFYMYGKAFQDVLTGNKVRGFARGTVVIPDDHNLFISKPPAPLFIPVDTTEERKLVFILLKEDDPRILNNPTRQRLFKEYCQ